VNVALQALQAAVMLELVGVRHRYDGRVVLDIERFAVAPGRAWR